MDIMETGCENMERNHMAELLHKNVVNFYVH